MGEYDAPKPSPATTSESARRGRAAFESAKAASRHPVRRLHDRLHANPVTGLVTKVVLTVVGGAVMLAGVIMIFTPGQGILAIILGLAILSLEYQWAARLLERAKAKLRAARDKARQTDPRVRRQRLILATAGALLLVAVGAGYILGFGWPAYAVQGWDWVQSLHEVVPELPGM